jgi:diguanylate cyclase (GGDEF)-like protein/PAS domain S-box-containing protein
MLLFVVTFQPIPGVVEPAYVLPASLALALMPGVLALAQLVPALRASRPMAVWSFAVDAFAVLTMIALYAFEPRRNEMGLLLVVQAEGGLLLGLPGGLWAWGATTLGSIAIDAMSASHTGIGIDERDVILRTLIGLLLAIGGGSVSAELSGERARRLADREAELEAAREEQERYRQLVEETPAVTYIRAPDRSGSTAYMSPQITSMLGFAPNEWVADPDLWASRLHPDDRARIVAESDSANATGRPFVQEYRMLNRDGRVVWIRDEALPLRDADGSLLSWHGVMTDITERKRVEEQVAFIAYHDPVTGLPNRIMFEESLDRAVTLARWRGTALAVLYMDLDDFKAVNDTLGHHAGDAFLREIADRLKGAVREADLVARQSGDEFLVLLADLADGSQEGDGVARAIAARIREALEPPVVIAGLPFWPSVSIGIALFPAAATDGHALLIEADAAMYRSKRAGPGRVTVSTGDGAWSMSGGSLAARLRRAVETGSWAVHYQPVVDLDSGVVVGLEALVRWRDESGALVPPAGFLQVAEDAGLLDAIDDWVFDEILRQVASWRREGLRLPGPVSVNLSRDRCRRGDPGPVMLERVRGAGLEPGVVSVEVPDSPSLSEPGTHRAVQSLRAGGFRVAVDDFGTGSSSLAMLRDVRVDAVKIDRPFLRNVPDDLDASRMLEALIALARSLRIEPVAEGVETEEQRAFLAGAGCRLGQGYLFSPPVPPSEVVALIERGRAAIGGPRAGGAGRGGPGR